MKTIELKVEGMSCSHCENAVKTAVGALTAVAEVLVSLEHKTVSVTFDETLVTDDVIKKAIEDQGYDVVA